MAKADEKPSKPRPDFPLTAHSSGKWCKKIRGRIHYFGRWDDPEGAEREYDSVKFELLRGFRPVPDNADLTVEQCFQRFLSRQMDRVETGRVGSRHYAEIKSCLAEFATIVNPKRLASELRPSDFANARRRWEKRWKSRTLNKNMGHVLSAFKWSMQNGLIAKQVVSGDAFERTPIAHYRREDQKKKLAHGAKLFQPEEIRLMIRSADPVMKAMILLGVNCGFLGKDIATLDKRAIDFKNHWLEFVRAKTGNLRAAPLWTETLEAVREAIVIRPKARSETDDVLVFLTAHGNRWVEDIATRIDGDISKVAHKDAVGHKFTKLMKSLGIRRHGRNFSTLRTTFRTAADEVGDRNACLLMMGQSFPDMDAWYVRAVSKKRMREVSNHVRKTLLNPK